MGLESPLHQVTLMAAPMQAGCSIGFAWADSRRHRGRGINETVIAIQIEHQSLLCPCRCMLLTAALALPLLPILHSDDQQIVWLLSLCPPALMRAGVCCGAESGVGVWVDSRAGAACSAGLGAAVGRCGAARRIHRSRCFELYPAPLLASPILVRPFFCYH